MKKTMVLFAALVCLSGIGRVTAEDIVPVKTISMNYPTVVSEPDPNNNSYVFIFKGEDADAKKWRVQINYISSSIYGTFTDADFYNLDDLAEPGARYNYIRTEDGMNFFPFKHLTASVIYHQDSVVLDVNGLYQNSSDRWERVLIHGILPIPVPTDTVYADLGVVKETPVYEGVKLQAANADYTLLWAIGGKSLLQAGTYYMADMAQPQFVHVADNDTIEPLSAEATVKDREEGCFDVEMRILSADNVLYVLTMHTTIEVRGTVQVECLRGQLLEKPEFDMFQFYGAGMDYNAAVSVKRSAVTGGEQTIPQDSLVLAYTAVARLSDQVTIGVRKAEVGIKNAPAAGKKILYADLYGNNDTLYQVTIPIGYSYLPATKDTVTIDFGTGVGRVDYSQGVGMIGFVLADEGDVDVHVSAYCGMQLSGTIYSDYFNYDGCYVTTYTETGARFADIRLAQMTLDSVGDVLHITLDAVTVADTTYHMTARLLPKYALTGEEVAYSVDIADAVQMVALTTDNTVYRMQLQRADQWTEEGEPLGDVELWGFQFYQPEPNTIAGTYGYSAGNLDIEQQMVIVEDGTEIYLAPFAGTLALTCGDELSLNISGKTYKTHYYEVSASVLAENGIIYHLEGTTFLLCVNVETGEWVELTENMSALNDALMEHGFRVRKVLRDGRILIECADGTFDMQGVRQ